MKLSPIQVQLNPIFRPQAKAQFGCGICAAAGGAFAAGVVGAAATGVSHSQAVTAGRIATALGGLSATMAKMSLANWFEPVTAAFMAGGAGILAAATATLGILKLSS